MPSREGSTERSQSLEDWCDSLPPLPAMFQNLVSDVSGKPIPVRSACAVDDNYRSQSMQPSMPNQNYHSSIKVVYSPKTGKKRNHNLLTRQNAISEETHQANTHVETYSDSTSTTDSSDDIPVLMDSDGQCSFLVRI